MSKVNFNVEARAHREMDDRRGRSHLRDLSAEMKALGESLLRLSEMAQAASCLPELPEYRMLPVTLAFQASQITERAEEVVAFARLAVGLKAKWPEPKRREDDDSDEPV